MFTVTPRSRYCCGSLMGLSCRFLLQASQYEMTAYVHLNCPTGWLHPKDGDAGEGGPAGLAA